jgi:hypothetical protein
MARRSAVAGHGRALLWGNWAAGVGATRRGQCCSCRGKLRRIGRPQSTLKRSSALSVRGTVAAAAAPSERLPTAARDPPLPPTTAGKLPFTSRTMLAAAQRLAHAGRLMVHEDAARRHNRASAALESYGGHTQQRGRWLCHEAGGRLPDNSGPLPNWSELSEAAKRGI